MPADPSSAAFPLVAALIVPGSDVTIEGVMINPLRSGLLDDAPGDGRRHRAPERARGGRREVADLRVRASRLSGVDVPARARPSMIDEYPILAVAAAFAEGETRMRGLHELRVKESDRLAAVAAGWRQPACRPGHRRATTSSSQGGGGRCAAAARSTTHLDHRIAMAFLVMGLASPSP